MKWIFLLLLLIACGKKTEVIKEDYQFVEPPSNWTVVESGDHVVVQWNASKGSDVTGYKIFWDILRPHTPTATDGRHWVGEGFTKAADCGLKRTHAFNYRIGTVIEMWLKAYDSRGNYSLASEIKYYPKKPPGYKELSDPINPRPFDFRIDDPWNGHLYKTGEDIELSWDDPVSGSADSYEVKVELINDEAHVATHIYPETSALSMFVERPHGFVGLCKFYIRAKHGDTWSEWITGDSIDGQVEIDGQWTNTNWLLYWMIQAPTWPGE